MKVNASPRQGADLWNRIATTVGVNGPERLERRHLNNITLDAFEAGRLLDYARTFLPAHANATADTFAWKDAERLPLVAIERELIEPLHELLTAPVDFASERGRARESLKRALGLVGDTDFAVTSALLETYGTKHLENAAVFYNGHTTVASTTLFPTLHALGLAEAGYRRSSYSGDAGVASLFATMLREHLAGGELGNDPGAALVQRLAESPKSPIIVINGGPLLAGRTLPPVVVERIARGDIRFVLHNAADVEAMKSLGVPAVVVDVAHSIAKVIEARVIGEQLAVHGAAVLWEGAHVAARDAAIIIKGYGLIGSSIANGYLSFGADPSRIVVVDPSPAAREAARAAGFTDVHETLPNLSGVMHGIVFEATNGVGLSRYDVTRLPRNAYALTATSGGQGIDVEDIRAGGDRELAAREYRFRAHGVSIGKHNFFSDVVVRDRETGHYLTIVNCRQDGFGRWQAFPQNLVEPIGQQRLVTSPMLAIAVCRAQMVSTPGVHGLAPEDVDLLTGALPDATQGPLIAELLPKGMRVAARGIAAEG